MKKMTKKFNARFCFNSVGVRSVLRFVVNMKNFFSLKVLFDEVDRGLQYKKTFC